MTNTTIATILIAEIRIVNPRSRNRVTFHAIKTNIGSVGLKKPITVHQRALEDDGTRYDLVCGQGRLESVRDLGETMIPAIISNAPEDERYLMSLVENLARRASSTTDLLREVKRLNAQDDKPAAIAEKLGLDKTYIYGIINLLRHGEEDLIRRVEAGRLPLTLRSNSPPAKTPTSNAHSRKPTTTEHCAATNCAPSKNSSINAKETKARKRANERSRVPISYAPTSTTPNSSARSCAAPPSSRNDSPS